MSTDNNYNRINNVKKHSEKSLKTPPARIHANSLFKFMHKLEYLESIIRDKKVYPRYVVEPVDYLKLKNIRNMAFPMICFCDINLHNLDEHINKYGNYGIAFSKEWGVKQNIQPIQYINTNSALRKDFTTVFNKALKDDPQTKTEENYINYLFHQVMFFKPYEKRKSGMISRFIDECEWRHIARVSDYDYPLVLWEDRKLDSDYLHKISDSLSNLKTIGLTFEYADIKYLIVENQSDFEQLIQTIHLLDLDETDKDNLISKVMIWDSCREDL